MNDLIQKLESYNWTDELGHPLVNCVEWEELKKKCDMIEKFIKLQMEFEKLKNSLND
jgi:hypothetical protein